MLVQTIPVLSLDDFAQPARRSAFVQSFGQALERFGFFALEHHGIDARLVQSAYSAAEAFFALPDHAKHQYEKAELKGQRGFTRFGKEHAKDHSVPDLKEFWHVGRPDDASLPNLWPKQVPQFQPAMTTLFEQIEACALQLLEACALYLGQPADWFTPEVTGGSSILRIIHYPPVPPTVEPQSMRAAPHEDINLITLLCEATSAGLELLQANGEWLPIQPIPGQIIVDTGDMLQALSNGLIKSTTHRVTNPDSRRDRRFSMPFFVHPRPSFDLTPLPQCIARTGGATRFPVQTAGQYLQARLREIGLA
ncbi:MAG: 2-oxoglutarate and iron-dependent oxygenase domain-containing protein [Cyanobacteria bacterium J06629_9]